MNRVRDLLYLLFGYLSGCVLYAEVFSRVFHKEIASAAKDKNPGAANAFVHGGFWCGVLTLAGDMLKGMVPVALYMHYLPDALLTPLAPLVLCAPVAGHVFPATRSFRGGKGIATTFGCLLGLLPFWTPVLVLACIFIFYSTILRITPNLSRTGDILHAAAGDAADGSAVVDLLRYAVHDGHGAGAPAHQHRGAGETGGASALVDLTETGRRKHVQNPHRRG